MRHGTLAKIAASSLIMATSMVGCTGAAYRTAPAFAGSHEDGDIAKLAARAEKALARRDFAEAQRDAEAVVAARPDSGPYRTLLGRSYLANGRYASAETAFRDAMTLGNSDSRTIVSLALILSARGDAAGARALLADQMDRVPAADYGLAMAMAGDAPEGIRVLSEAIHDPSADARTRQNLAYAYAMAGDWRQARMMAEADLDPKVAAQHVLDWARTAQPGAEAERVAALIGVNPQPNDPGLPSRLALAPTSRPEAAPVALASAAGTPLAAPAADEAAAAAPVEVAQTAPVEWPARVSTPAFAMIQPLPADYKPANYVAAEEQPVPARATRASLIHKAAYIQPVSADAASAWVVQIGAYDSAAVAQEKWQNMARYDRVLGAFAPVNSTATVDGRLYYRLAVSGFADRAGADRFCRSLRARSMPCFVRQGEPDAKAEHWAAAPRGKQLASR